MELYVLRIDNYKEWAWENGACSLLGIYDTKEQAFKELDKYMAIDIEEDRILDYDFKDSVEYKNSNERINFYVDIYESEFDKEQGNNLGTYVIEKKILNESGVFI